MRTLPFLNYLQEKRWLINQLSALVHPGWVFESPHLDAVNITKTVRSRTVVAS